IVGGLLTLAGLVLIVLARTDAPGQPRPWRGVVEPLRAALAWGVSVVALRVPLDEIDPVSAQAIRLPVGALILWVTPWAMRGVPVLMRGGWPPLLRLIVLAVVTAVSSLLYGASVKYAGVAVARACCRRRRHCSPSRSALCFSASGCRGSRWSERPSR